MQLINDLAEQYAGSYTSPVDAVLQQVFDYTVANHPEAQMISGPVQGKFLEFISLMLRPANILEIGTFTGFSAICLAKGLKENGQLHTIELREEEAGTARKNISLAGMDQKIRVHVGDAKQVIAKLDYIWDLVFIDADKTGYIEYYEMVLPRLHTNGVIIADNVLFHGEVLVESPTGKNAIAISAFNEHLKTDSRVETTFLTIRDGLMMIRKK